MENQDKQKTIGCNHGSKDDDDDKDKNIFFMTSNVRRGNGHVTPEDLKNKLLEYKNQLDVVKNIFQSREINNNTNNNNRQYSDQCIVGEEEDNVKEAANITNKPSLTRNFDKNEDDCFPLFPQNYKIEYADCMDDRVTAFSTDFLLTQQKYHHDSNVTSDGNDAGEEDFNQSNLSQFNENTKHGENIKHDKDNKDSQDEEIRRFLPIEPRTNKEEEQQDDQLAIQKNKSETNNNGISNTNGIRTINRTNRTTKPSRLRTPTPVFRNTENTNNKTITSNIPKKQNNNTKETSVLKRGPGSTTINQKKTTSTSNRMNTKPLARGMAIKISVSKTKIKPNAQSFSVNFQSNSKDESASSSPVKSPSSSSMRPKGTWLNVQNAQKTVQRLKQRKCAQKQSTKAESIPSSPKNNHNNKKSNPIPIQRRNNLKYERSDSELSSCSNASSCFTGKCHRLLWWENYGNHF